MRLFVPLLMLVVLAGCGGEEAEPPVAENPDTLLAASLGGVNRSTEPKVFVGEDLYEHINGGAETYHMYDFKEVTTAYYSRDSIEVLADVFEFSDADNAFGLYSSLRPDEFESSPLGVEGFSATGNTVFVKGPCVVSITGFDETASTAALMAAIALAIAEKLPGTSDLPETFGLFPGMFALEHSERMIAASYMGRQFLTDVYSMDFALDNDTLRLLLSEDRSGAKFLQWSTTGEMDATTAQSVSDLPFDDGNILAFQNDYHGTVVAGLKGGYLLGVVNYSGEHKEFLEAWLEEMPQP